MTSPSRIGAIGLAVLSWGIVSGAFVGVQTARGEETDDERSERAKAEEHFSRGAELFLKEKYERAILEFRRAYQYRKNPMILFNQSVAHARIGDVGKAIEVAERAGEAGLPEKARAKNRARIAAWRMRLQSAARTEALAEKRARERRARSSPPPQPSRESSFTWLGWSGVASSVVGLGGIGYAVYVDARVADEIPKYRRAARRGEAEAFAERRDAIERRQLRGRVALYAGGALLAAGTAAWLVDLLDDSGGERSPRAVSPSVRGGSTGFSVRF